VLLVCAALTVQVRAAEPIVATDLLRIRTVSAIEVSRDGSTAIVVINSIGELPADDHLDDAAQPRLVNQSHLWAFSLFADPPVVRQLTFGHRNDAQPQLSPDGKQVVFVRGGRDETSGSTDKPQVWILPLEGGEAHQVTHFEHGATSPKWLPGGRQLLVSSDVPMDEMEGAPPWPIERSKRTFGDDALPQGVEPMADGSKEQIRAWLARNEHDNNPRAITRLNFLGEHELLDAEEFTHLFVVDVNDAKAMPRRVTSGFFDHTSAAIMPSGKAIVYAAKKPTNKHPDRVLFTDLWMINIDGTNDHKLLALDGWSLNNPKPSQDGSVIAFTASRIDEPAYRLSRLGIIPSSPAQENAPVEPTWLTDDETQSADIISYQWNPARGASIVFNTASEGAYPLMTISFGLLEPAVLVDEYEGTKAGALQFGVGGGAIVYARSTFANPCELRVLDTNGDRSLHDLNAWTRNKTISRPREGWITRPDGTKVQYWIMEPTQREQKQRYPLVLEMHGGPMWMWGPGENTMWLEFQLLCSFGYGVAYANPRGSTGYGYTFQRGNFQDWGEGPAGDVLAVCDKAIVEDWVDKDRLLLTGGSYAGYLTAWIIGNDHRFKAAVAQRGVYDLATFFGEGNAWQLVEWCFGGMPFDARVRDVLARNNPFSFAGRVRTPLLIIHGDNDLRTGVSQSEMMYRALKAQGKPAEYARYPNAGHDLSRTGDPTQRLDRLLRIIEFFDRHISNPRPAPEVGAAASVPTTPDTASLPSAN